MRLYLVRHATAVPHGNPEYEDDAERPLTEDGREQARQAAEGLRRLNVPVDAVVTSPFVRAVQTAECVARAFGFENKLRMLDALEPDVDPAKTSGALRGLAAYRHVVLVGHEPHMSAWLGWLVAGPSGIRCEFKKGGAACVEVERVPPLSGDGTLRWLMTSKHLALIGRAE